MVSQHATQPFAKVYGFYREMGPPIQRRLNGPCAAAYALTSSWRRASAAARSGDASASFTFSLPGGNNPGSGAPVKEALASPERAAALARRQAE